MIRKIALILFVFSQFAYTVDTGQVEQSFQNAQINENEPGTDHEGGLLENNASSSDVQRSQQPYLQINLSKKQLGCVLVSTACIGMGIGIMLSLLLKTV